MAGLELFRGKAGCVTCHIIGARDALFSDGRYHITGAGSVAHAARFTVPLAPGVSTVLSDAELGSFAVHEPPDLGRFRITQKPEDRHAFKTPSLRNVSRSAPYMHDGTLATLEDVVEFYDQGGNKNPNLDPEISPLRLAPEEKRALVAFLQTLGGEITEGEPPAGR